MAILSTPVMLSRRAIKNRLVMPPMVLFKPREASWPPDQKHLEHYARRAQAGTGLIIVEATAIDPLGRLAPFQLRAWDDEHIPALARIAHTIKEHGAVAMIQINHAGANTRPEYLDDETAVSPSGIPADSTVPRTLSSAEIDRLVRAFAAAARRCLDAGFDGIELHGAHGYLLSQFLSPAFNKRTDAWGGASVVERLAFPHAVVRAVRAVIGQHALLGYRLGAVEYIKDGLPLADGLAAARSLAASGALDVLHISSGMGGGDWPSPPPDFGFGQLLWLSAQAKKVVALPVIGVGGIRTGAEAQAALDRNVADLIAVGRAMLADPDWAAKALRGADRDILLCRHCQRCAHFFPDRRCAASRA